MLERYSHVRMEAKRSAMGALAVSTKTAGHDTNHDTNPATARGAASRFCEFIWGLIYG